MVCKVRPLLKCSAVPRGSAASPITSAAGRMRGEPCSDHFIYGEMHQNPLQRISLPMMIMTDPDRGKPLEMPALMLNVEDLNLDKVGEFDAAQTSSEEDSHSNSSRTRQTQLAAAAVARRAE